jgi:hypothetical protein
MDVNRENITDILNNEKYSSSGVSLTKSEILDNLENSDPN